MCSVGAIQDTQHIWQDCSNEHVAFYRKRYLHRQQRCWAQHQLFARVLEEKAPPQATDWFDMAKIVSMASSGLEFVSYIREITNLFITLLRLKDSIIFLANYREMG